MIDNLLLSSDRLILRRVQTTDTCSLVELAGDFLVAEMMNGSIPHPYHLADATAWVEKHKDDSSTSQSISWVITDKNFGKLVGSIQIRLDESRLSARLSYWIGQVFWNKGFASEAVKSVVDFAKTLKLSQLTAEHFERNPASGRVLTKAGFQFCGKREYIEKLHNKPEMMMEYKLLL